MRIHFLFLFLSIALCSTAQRSLEWAHCFTSGQFAMLDLAKDRDQNIILSGTTPGLFDIDPSADSNFLSSSFKIFTGKFNSNGSLLWAFDIPTYCPVYFPQLVVADSSSNIILAGSIGDSADMDPGPGIHLFTGSWLGSGYIAKYDSSGTFMWASQLVCNKMPQITGICTDQDGNVYVTGTFKDTLILNPHGNSVVLGTQGDAAFYCKYNATGALSWAYQLTPTAYGYADGGDIAVTSEGELVLTFIPCGLFDLDPGADTVLTPGNLGLAIIKLDSNGNYRSSTYFTGMCNVLFAEDLLIDAESNIYVTGNSNGPIDFDTSSASYIPYQGAYGSHAFCIKFTYDLRIIWGISIGGMYGSSNIKSIDVNDNNDCWISGQISSTTDLDPSANSLWLTVQQQSSDGFVAGFSSDGTLINAVAIGSDSTTTSDECMALVCLDSSIVVTGISNRYTDFDPDTGSCVLGSSSLWNMFLAEYSLQQFIYSPQPESSFEIFPNPSNGNVFINSSGLVSPSLEIYDATGRLVMTMLLENPLFEIDLHYLSNGVYVLQIVHLNGYESTKLVLSH